MELCDRRPSKRFTDRSKNIHFKVVQTKEGLFNLYESNDKEKWKLSKKALTILEVMEAQAATVNSNLLNYINFLSIIKGKKDEKPIKKNRKMD
jgi:hypothetical protein